jgi:hypothetical protein
MIGDRMDRSDVESAMLDISTDLAKDMNESEFVSEDINAQLRAIIKLLQVIIYCLADSDGSS